MEPPGGIRPPSRPYEGRVLSLNYGGENGQTGRRVRSASLGMRSHKRRPILDVHDAKHLRRDGVLGSAPSCRTGGGEALRRLKLDTSTPVRVSPRTSRANSAAAIAGRWPRRTDGCVNFSWCGLVTEGADFVNERKRDHPSDARSLLNRATSISFVSRFDVPSDYSNTLLRGVPAFLPVGFHVRRCARRLRRRTARARRVLRWCDPLPTR